MSENYIFEGKTTNEAIEKGLKELKLSKNDVEIKVLDEEKRSFFSILEKRVVKVEMKIKENSKKTAETNREQHSTSPENLEKALKNVNEFLDKWLPTISNEKLEYKTQINNGYIEIEFMGENVSFLIGYRGEVLNSLQVILSSIAGKNISEKVRVTLDISGYKEKRQKILIAFAEKEAKKVSKTRRAITLEPMTPYERKIIHTALQNHPTVTTKSIGEGHNRKVVIYYKK